MNKDQVAGKAEELKGKVKEGIGNATDNPNTQSSGIKDQVKGKVQQAFGDAKEAAKEATKDHE